MDKLKRNNKRSLLKYFFNIFAIEFAILGLLMQQLISGVDLDP